MKTSAKIWLIIGAVLTFLGLVTMVFALVLTRGNFDIFGNATYETVTFDCPESFRNISILSHTEDIVFEPSGDGLCHVTIRKPKRRTAEAFVRDDTLTIETREDGPWYEHLLFFSLESSRITVSLPRGTYESLKIRESTGDVTLPADFRFGAIDIEASTGDVTSSASAEKEFRIKLSTGKLVLTNVTASSLSLNSSTGDMTLRQCDAEKIEIKTSTGDVTASFKTGKTFSVKTSTGRVSVPENTPGGTCTVKTSTGDIRIKIEP